MQSHRSVNNQLSLRTKDYGLELQSLHRIQSGVEIIHDQIRDLPEFQGISIEELRSKVRLHLFNYLDSYIDPSMDPRWLNHPEMVATSRALGITLVIVDESDRLPALIIKQRDALKTVYLGHAGNQQYHPCRLSLLLSKFNLADFIELTKIDNKNPQHNDASPGKALFKAAENAIDKTVKDPSYMGWFQILVGPKSQMPDKNFHRDLIIVKNEIYMTLTTLHSVIKCALPQIENEFMENRLETEINDNKDIAIKKIKIRLQTAQKELSEIQLKILTYQFEPQCDLDSMIKIAKQEYNYSYNGKKLDFLIPIDADEIAIEHYRKFFKIENKRLESIKKIQKEHDDILRELHISVPEMLENIRGFFSINLKTCIATPENISWNAPELTDLPSYTKRNLQSYGAQVYQQPLPISCYPVPPHLPLLRKSSAELRVMNPDGRTAIDVYGSSRVAYMDFFANLLQKMKFEIMGTHEIDRLVLLDKFASAFKIYKPGMTTDYENYLHEITQDRISETVRQKFIAERKTEIEKAAQTSEQTINNLIPITPIIKLNTLIDILEKHLLQLKEKMEKLEKTVTNDEQEKSNYIKQTTLWFNVNSNKLSVFIRLFTPAELSTIIIDSGKERNSLETFCEEPTGDTLLHKANAHPEMQYNLNNVVMLIKFLIVQGANMLAQNRRGEYACDLLSDNFTSRLPWSLARTQLELLTTYTSNLASMVADSLMQYIKYNETSWWFYFHDKSIKKTRLELVFQLFVSLNQSRLDADDENLINTVSSVRAKIFTAERAKKSQLHDTIVFIVKELEARSLVIADNCHNDMFGINVAFREPPIDENEDNEHKYDSEDEHKEIVRADKKEQEYEEPVNSQAREEDGAEPKLRL